MDILIAIVVIALLHLLVYCLFRLKTHVKVNSPPLQSGFIPWLGVAVEFGKEPLHYIEKTRQKLGDVFTILAAGKKMTFIFNHNDHKMFFYSRNASFGAAVQPFTKAAANISKKSFLSHHTLIHDTVKGKLTASYAETLCPQLSKAFYENILKALQYTKQHNKEDIDLAQFVQTSMFPAVVSELFGRDNISLSDDELLHMLEEFRKYDIEFEYGVELPSLFVRNWSKCKYRLLEIFKGVVERVEKKKGPPKLLVEHLISSVDSDNAPGFSLLLLWASQANAIPISFWTLSFILSNPDVLSEIQKELKNFTFDCNNGAEVNSLKTVPSIRRAVLEAIRLRSPGMITRKLTDSISVQGYTVPAGHLLMLSPYWTHRNTEYFPEPNKFIPDRWLECNLDKGEFLPGFIAFGGGRYQCPGRWFALMEIHLYVAMVLKMLNITLLDPVPQPSPLHLIGSQQPIGKCRAKITKN